MDASNELLPPTPRIPGPRPALPLPCATCGGPGLKAGLPTRGRFVGRGRLCGHVDRLQERPCRPRGSKCQHDQSASGSIIVPVPRNSDRQRSKTHGADGKDEEGQRKGKVRETARTPRARRRRAGRTSSAPRLGDQVSQPPPTPCDPDAPRHDGRYWDPRPGLDPETHITTWTHRWRK